VGPVTLDLFTSHWRNRDLAGVDAVMVAISRGKPRWPLDFRYRVLRELAPNDRTWAQEDEEAFEASYVRQLEELGAEAILERLAGIGDGSPVVLLCWEKPHEEEYCHRWTLAGFLEREAGVRVPELQPGDVPLREDPAEPTLFDREEERA
jgi:hypothetical protein